MLKATCEKNYPLSGMRKLRDRESKHLFEVTLAVRNRRGSYSGLLSEVGSSWDMKHTLNSVLVQLFFPETLHTRGSQTQFNPSRSKNAKQFERQRSALFLLLKGMTKTIKKRRPQTVYNDQGGLLKTQNLPLSRIHIVILK